MTETQRQAMMAALDAIKPVMGFGRVGSKDTEQAALQSAYESLHNALAEPVVGPVAWVYRGGPFPRYDTQQYFRGIGGYWVVGEPLYAVPPPPADVQLLTDDEIATALPWAGFDDLIESYSARQLHAALRAIEQAVRQKAGIA